ncbi:MAG: helix-turn-helix domain-containing protein [Dysgonamonadaceae bacterium]|jgi:HTH-type transcriptional regulator/antitoxin HigA|nr:helix-turn-helix domain-containing protein [Dysgonamonadaceae bacterium]
MDLKNIKKIETEEQYEAVRIRVNELIVEASEKGLLESDYDNEYTREIGRLSYLGAMYENDYVQFKHLNVRRKSPLIRSIEDEMYSRNIKQKELAEMLDINEPTLSQIMRQKRSISMRMAKKLHKSLNIDPKLIIDYA